MFFFPWASQAKLEAQSKMSSFCSDTLYTLLTGGILAMQVSSSGLALGERKTEKDLRGREGTGVERGGN